MDLFEHRQPTKEPLAARMRPRTLDEYIGQEHIVGKGRLLRRAIAADQLTSVIFYGPPGTGKTTLARVIANHTKSNFITLNAVLTGVQNIREAISQAEDHYKLYSRRTILFVDEVHRWNRSQQDALLPWVENGTIILVGATTENPFFEVNKALVSRSRVFQLLPLESKHLFQAATAALQDRERGYGRWKVIFEAGALEHLVDTANGDARSLLNALELAVETTPEHWNPEATPPIPAEGTEIYITKEAAEESIQKKVVLYDRDGDYHYDVISAFIKSLRGRDPDAALYWLARMVTAGEDPGFIFRRMLISACEDTGLADPMAVSVVESCAAAFDRVGLPEGRYHLAHAALYLATAPKSNSSLAFFDALAAVEKENAEVPNHLKDGNRDAKGFGHGAGYLYPHAYTDHWVAQQYLPDALNGRVFYNPSSQGYENSIRQEVLARREAQIAALLEEEALLKETGRNASSGKEDQQNLENLWWQTEHFKVSPTKDGGNLTYSPENKAHQQALSRGEAEWRRRAMSTKSQLLQEIRKTILYQAAPARHSRHFIWNIDDGLLIWECMRQSPEGLVAGVCSSAAGMKILQQYSNTLEELLRPQLALVTDIVPNQLSAGSFIIPTGEQGAQWEELPFDRLYLRDILSTEASITSFCHSLKQAASQNQLAPGWKLMLHQKIPSQGQCLSALLHQHSESPLIQKMALCEEDFFGNRANPLFSWNQQTVATSLATDFEVAFQNQQLSEQRSLTQEEILRWLHPSASAYGSHLAQQLSSQELAEITRLLLQATATPVNWNYQSACFVVQAKNQQ